MTDWLKMAEPRDDALDTAAVLVLASAAGFVRTPVPAGAQLLLGVEIRPALDFAPKITGLVIAAIDSAYVAEVEALVGCWPAMDAQARALLTALYPTVRASGARVREFGGSYGTRDQDVAAHFGQVYATVDSAHGFAEGIVSSLANWKLYAMGVRTREWDRVLLGNAAADVAELPLRSGEMRPLGAVLHAVYAMLHILEWNLRVARSGLKAYERACAHAIVANAGRIAKGWVALDAAARPTADGAAFLAACRAWSDRLTGEAAAWR